jgi:hypothetical protein
VDALKIDRSLARGMQTDRATSDPVEVLIALAHKTKLRALAQGVETSRQLERLLELDWEFGQGYYFSQPLDAKAAQLFMRQVAPTRATRVGAKESLTQIPLARAVSRRNHSAVLGSAAQAIEHAPSMERDFANGLFPLALIA